MSWKTFLLKRKKYRYIDITRNFDPVQKVYGFIAEEVQEVLPEADDDNNQELIPNIYRMGCVKGDIFEIEKQLEIGVEYTTYLYTDVENADKFKTIVLDMIRDKFRSRTSYSNSRRL